MVVAKEMRLAFGKTKTTICYSIQNNFARVEDCEKACLRPKTNLAELVTTTTTTTTTTFSTTRQTIGQVKAASRFVFYLIHSFPPQQQFTFGA